MPILDANIFTQIAKGNVPAAEALLRMIRNAISRPIYVSRTAYNSLVRDSPTQALRDGYRAIIEDLDLDIAPDVNMADRVDLYRDNIQYEPGRNQPGRIEQYGKGSQGTAGRHVRRRRSQEPEDRAVDARCAVCQTRRQPGHHDRA
jgi:hypothetical protein